MWLAPAATVVVATDAVTGVVVVAAAGAVVVDVVETGGGLVSRGTPVDEGQGADGAAPLRSEG